MLPRQDPPRALLALAEQQSAVLTTEQVLGHGLNRRALERLVGQRQWHRIDRSVYLTRPGDPNWLGLAWAGVLLGGDHARLGGPAAGYLHALVEAEPDVLTVLVPESQVTRSRQRWEFRREREGVRSPRSPGSPPRTTIEDTVLDLCDEGSGERAVGWVTSAVQSHKTTPAQLRRALQRRTRARHRRLLQELLGDVAAGAESALEIRYLRDVERAHGLPSGDRQNRSALPFRRDVVYLDYGLVVELDGRLGHAGMGRFRDMRRDNLTLLAGQPTLRYGFVDVSQQACEVARQVAQILRRLGWTGLLQSCRHCALVPEYTS